MHTSPVFRGNQQEFEALVVAIARYCECQIDPSFGARTQTCGAHRLLVTDQGYMDRMLFFRRVRARLQREEFTE